VARWLVKEDPECYTFAAFLREKRTQWDGVHNALALRHLRAMRKGDEGFYYSSGHEKAIVGLFRVDGAPRPDPEDDRGSWRVPLRVVRPLRRPIPLATLRRDARLVDWELIRISRLAVMPVPDAVWRAVLGYEDEA